MSTFSFEANLGSETAEVKTEVWESGGKTLPDHLEEKAQERISKSLDAFKGGKSLEELNNNLIEKGKMLICAGSPAICWNPSKTITKPKV